METLFDLWSNLSHQSVQLAINAIWIGLTLTGGAWLALRWTGHAAAGARLTLWWAVLLIVLALPLLAVSPLDKLWPNFSSSINTTAAEPVASAQTEPARVVKPVKADGTQFRDRRVSPPAREIVPQEIETKPDSGSLALRLVPITLTLIWLGATLLLLGRLGLAYGRMRAIKSRSESFDTGHLARVSQLVRDSQRRISIRKSHDAVVPIAAGLGRPMILIPNRLTEALTDRELEAVILHELAHLNRRDDWSKLVQKIIEALFFFHPAVHIISHQLELERELACDEWAIAQTGTADRYAKSLTRLVQLTSGTATTLIPGALSSRKQIFRRFERLLIQDSSKRSPRRTGLKLASLVAVIGLTALFVVQVVPAIGLPLEPVTFAELTAPDGDDDTGSSGIKKTEPDTVPARTIGTAYVEDGTILGATTRRKGRTVTTTYNDGDFEMSATVRGEVELTKDSRTVRRLSRGSTLDFAYKSDSEERRLLVEPGSGRDLDYTYTIDDETREYDRDAKDWFAGALESFVSATGFGAEAHLREILTEDGLQACLEYIEDDVESNAQLHYYEQLMAFDHLGFRDLRQIRRHADETLKERYARESVEEQIAKRIAYMRKWDRNELPTAPLVPTVSALPAVLAIPDVASIPAVSSLASGRSRSSSSSRSSSRSRSQYQRWDDSDDDWTVDYSSGNVRTTYRGNNWSSYGRDRSTEGEWDARFNRSRSRVQLELEGYDGDYSLSFPVPLAELDGLTSDQIVDGADEVSFSYKRGPGIFHFTGDFGRGRGGGDYTFESNPEYLESLEDLGYKTSRLTDWRLFELAIHDVSLDYIKEMSEQGLGLLRLNKLVEMRIHDIEPRYVAEFAAMGYDDLSANDLIQFAIHDVEPELVEEMKSLNVRGLDGDAIVQLSIHDIDADYVREMAEIGYDGLSVDDLVQFGIHDVDPRLIQELKDLNVRGLDEDAIVQLSIHDIDADYVREMAEIGYDGLSVDDLVQFGIHDVDPDLIRELKEMKVRGLDEDAMVQLSIHDIDADFVRDFAELGYDGLSIDMLVQFGIHDVDPELVREMQALDIRGLDEDAFVQMSIHDIDADFVRDFVELGYDRLSVDRLVQFGIHNVTARFVGDLAELGYEDVDPDDLVAMKIHGITPSFIRRIQRRTDEDLSPDDLVDIKIHGYY